MSDVRIIPAELLKRAHKMRHEAAPAEQKLWQRLRNRQLANFKFRRQTPLPLFIADFYCSEIQLIVEVDGNSHAEREEYDARRTRRLMRDGHFVIRFLNTDVPSHIDSVSAEILAECVRLSKSKAPSP